MHSKNEFKWFALIISSLIIVLMVDIKAGVLYRKIHGISWYSNSIGGSKGKNTLRIKSSIYHHDLAKNVSDNNSKWGNATYTTKTNSLGFRDEINRNVYLKSEKKD